MTATNPVQTMPLSALSHSASVSSQHEPGRWAARLNCAFETRGRRTVLARRSHEGPLVVQRPFYPEASGTCHLYLVHPPGGIAGGDSLSFSASLGPESQALLTTPAATKVYRSTGRCSEATQHFTVSPGAELEWLPQETLLFDRSRARLQTRIDLLGDARFIGWEVVGLGRPASGEHFQNGTFRQRFELYRDGAPLFLERTRLSGTDEVLVAPWGLGGNPVFGTLVCTTEDPKALVAHVRTHLDCDAPGEFVVSALSGVMVARYVGPWTEHARTYFTAVWQLCRPLLLGRAATLPRIWAT